MGLRAAGLDANDLRFDLVVVSRAFGELALFLPEQVDFAAGLLFGSRKCDLTVTQLVRSCGSGRSGRTLATGKRRLVLSAAKRAARALAGALVVEGLLVQRDIGDPGLGVDQCQRLFFGNAKLASVEQRRVARGCEALGHVAAQTREQILRAGGLLRTERAGLLLRNLLSDSLRVGV